MSSLDEVSRSVARAPSRRWLAVGALVVLASILVPLACAAVWARRSVLETERFTATAIDVVSDGAVTRQVSLAITERAVDVVLSSDVASRLPGIVEPAASLARAALEGAVAERVEALLRSERGQALLADAIARSHRVAVRHLQGDGLLRDVMAIDDGVVTLDLVPIVREVLLRLQVDSLLPASVAVPPEGTTTSRLLDALGAQLPDDFGQVVVYRTDAASGGTLASAQRALVLAQRAMLILSIAAIAAVAAALVVAPNRARAIWWLGLGSAFVAGVSIVLVGRVGGALPDATTSPTGRAVTVALVASLRSGLERVLWVLALVAIAAAVVALVLDRRRRAAAASTGSRWAP